MGQNSYKDFVAWRKGMELAAMVYDASERFPWQERFGLTSQLRRPAVSVPSNIAEGKAHYSNRDFVRFLRHARGSLAEIETRVLIAQQRQYMPAETTTQRSQRLDELGRILSGLINSLKEQERTRDSGLRTQD